ncbi:MAG: hypothetical protein LBP59_02490 [Planctomycetaceae bacterium]|nr:hypothetical protein [Planctomycetaceae bacterium]
MLQKNCPTCSSSPLVPKNLVMKLIRLFAIEFSFNSACLAIGRQAFTLLHQ